MSLDILATAFISGMHEGLPDLLKGHVRGVVHFVNVQHYPPPSPVTFVTLQTTVGLPWMEPGKYGTERAVGDDIIRVLAGIPGATVREVQVLCLDSADWFEHTREE